MIPQCSVGFQRVFYPFGGTTVAPVGRRHANMFWPNPSIVKVKAAMLVEHAASLPEGEEWEYEYSWAGERVLAAKEGAGVRLTSVFHRRDVTNRFPVVAAAVAKLEPPMLVIDGVVGTFDPATVERHDADTESGLAAVRIALVASDLLWLDSVDVRQLALGERKQRLRELLNGSGILTTAAPRVPVGEMLVHARHLGADAVIAKRRASRYRPFGRSGDWIRVPVEPGRTGTSRSNRDRPSGGTAPGFGLGDQRAFGVGQFA
jgi:bifunctional non-homologous end joining protein LigD